MSEIVSLPEHLKDGSCGCGGKFGFHKTNCRAAIEYDDIPLADRPGYVWDETGQRSNRFESIRWEYPFHISGEIRIDLRIDIVQVILAHADNYLKYELDPDLGYAEWEKPIAWLYEEIKEAWWGVSFGSARLSWDSSDLDEVEEHPRWLPEDTARLDALLAERQAAQPSAVHPDQGTLIDE